MALAGLPMKKINILGLSLIELVVAMVVISVGLTGIFTLFITLANNSVSPLLEWQAITLGDSVLKEILNKEYRQIPCRDVLKPSNSICDYQNIQKANIETFFPQMSKVKQFPHFAISVEIKPYAELKNQEAALVSVIIEHPELGQIHFSGIKSQGFRDDTERLYTY